MFPIPLCCVGIVYLLNSLPLPKAPSSDSHTRDTRDICTVTKGEGTLDMYDVMAK